MTNRGGATSERYPDLNRQVWAEVETNAESFQDRSAVAHMLDLVHGELIGPLLDLERAGGWLKPGDASVVWGVPGNMTVRSRRYSPGTWDKRLAEFDRGELDSVSLGYWHGEPTDVVQRIATIDLGVFDNRIGFGATHSVLGREFEFFDESRWVGCLKSLAVELDAIRGYMTLDWASLAASPFEHKYGPPPLDADPELTVRGYYWGNVISARHLERLGGIGVLRSEAADLVIEELDGGSHAQTWLALPSPLVGLTLTALRQAKSVLEPLLPLAGSPRSTLLPVRVF